jgi:hypothetical protein
MARPGRPERNRAARSFRQLKRFHHVINSNKVFGTHRDLHLLFFASFPGALRDGPNSENGTFASFVNTNLPSGFASSLSNDANDLYLNLQFFTNAPRPEALRRIDLNSHPFRHWTRAGEFVCVSRAPGDLTPIKSRALLGYRCSIREKRVAPTTPLSP